MVLNSNPDLDKGVSKILKMIVMQFNDPNEAV